MAVLTNDGLTGFRRVGGSAGTPAGARSRRLASRPDRRRPVVQLPAAPGHPLLDRRARAAAGLPPGDRAHARADGPSERLLTRGIVGARSCLAAPKEPCDLSRGIVTDAGSNTITFHLTSPDPDFLYKLALPSAFAVPAGTPLHPRGFVPATGPYEIASFDPKRGDPARPQPEVSRVVACRPAERLPGHDRRALPGLGRRARRRGPARLGRSGLESSPARRRPCSPPCGRSMRASSSSTRGSSPTSSPSTRESRPSTTCASGGR